MDGAARAGVGESRRVLQHDGPLGRARRRGAPGARRALETDLRRPQRQGLPLHDVPGSGYRWSAVQSHSHFVHRFG